MRDRLLLSQLLVCAACGRRVGHADPTGPTGATGWLPCIERSGGGRGRERKYHGGCGAQTFYAVLAPGSTGADVVRLVGDALAERVLRAWVREDDGYAAARADAAALWAMPVTDGMRPAYLLVAARAHDRDRHRWATLAEVLRALGLNGEAA